MSGMYWIIMLDSICYFLKCVFCFSLAAAIIFNVVRIVNNCENENYDFRKKFGHIDVILTVVTVILGLCVTFIPNSKQMITIYGLGGTIDFIQNNDTAKELPDKCIQAIDIFFDEYIDSYEEDDVE